MSDDQPAEGRSSGEIAAGVNRQQGTRGLSVQGQIGDVHYHAVPCDHHSAASARRRLAGFSPLPYETLREELHRIIWACSRIVDDLRDDTDNSGGSPWN